MTATRPQDAGAALTARAEQVSAALCDQDAQWGTSGWTRRRFVAGLGMVGVAALGSQLVTTRAAYGATPVTNTVVTVFLRGAADGLRILVPASASLGMDYLSAVRGPLVPAPSQLIPLAGTGGWALNSAMAPLMPLWNSGELAFVPAVSTPGLSRSHFQAQQLIEAGGVATATTGWLDRVLQTLGPGTTFRAVSEGSALPQSMAGEQRKLVMSSLKNFTFPGWNGVAAQSETALRTLYRGMSGPLGEDVPTTLSAIATAETVQAGAAPRNGAVYPSGNFGSALADLASLLKAEVGLQVATVDVGGWDTHTDEAHDLDTQLAAASTALGAFMTDLGAERRKRVTVVVVTEFGRRVAMNASGGADHGHGSVMWLLGGGVVGSAVHGRWAPLTAGVLDSGDVPGLNNVFDVFGEVVRTRLGVSTLRAIFPALSPSPLGVTRAG